MVSIVIKSLGVATLSTLAAFLQGCDTIDAIDGILSDAVNGDDENQELDDTDVTPAEASTETNALRSGVLSAGN